MFARLGVQVSPGSGGDEAPAIQGLNLKCRLKESGNTGKTKAFSATIVAQTQEWARPRSPNFAQGTKNHWRSAILGHYQAGSDSNTMQSDLVLKYFKRLPAS